MRAMVIGLLLALCVMLTACGDNLELGLTGDPCDGDSDCEMGFCLEQLGDDEAPSIVFEDGYCTYSCNIEPDGTTSGCATGEICLIFNPDPFNPEPMYETFCAVSGCQTDHDCRDENYVCHRFYSGHTACIPVVGQRRLPKGKTIDIILDRY